MDIMQNSGSIYNVRMSSNGTVIYDLKPRVRRNSLTPKLAEAEDQGLLGDANAKELRNAHNLRKSRRISSNLRVRNASRKSFKIKRSDSHVAAEGNSGDRNQWLNSAYESFKQFLQNFRVWEDQNQNRVYFEQLASRLRQNLCQFQSRRIQLSDGYFPPTVTSGRCRKLDPKAKCLATKYSVQLLKKAENLCYPVPSTTANSTYEEVWVMTSIKVNVGCQTVFTRHGWNSSVRSSVTAFIFIVCTVRHFVYHRHRFMETEGCLNNS